MKFEVDLESLGLTEKKVKDMVDAAAKKEIAQLNKEIKSLKGKLTRRDSELKTLRYKYDLLKKKSESPISQRILRAWDDLGDAIQDAREEREENEDGYY